AVAAGAYPDVHVASAAMGSVDRGVYQPIPENVTAYDELFTEYVTLHDYFGRGANDVMHRLKARRRAVLAESPTADVSANVPAGEVEAPAADASLQAAADR
ncbi:MAG: ribulokinase, partial [Modestobacter sp.]|nr:ribulokinase [Modestobacter sp.]